MYAVYIVQHETLIVFSLSSNKFLPIYKAKSEVILLIMVTELRKTFHTDPGHEISLINFESASIHPQIASK